MSKTTLIAICLSLGFFVGAFGENYAITHPKPHTDNQTAAGEWKIELQTPPCDSYKNIQVIYPKESGAPMTVECDLMPVAEK